MTFSRCIPTPQAMAHCVCFPFLVNAKVAFSATVIESPDVFTGPADAQKILIFDRVFTNIGNAYSSKSGMLQINNLQMWKEVFKITHRLWGIICTKCKHHMQNFEKEVILKVESEAFIHFRLWTQHSNWAPPPRSMKYRNLARTTCTAIPLT